MPSIINTGIHNLSKKQLSSIEEYVLSLGSKFIFRPQDCTNKEVMQSLSNFERLVRLRSQFLFVEESKCGTDAAIRVPNPLYEPQPATKALESYLINVRTKLVEKLRKFSWHYYNIPNCIKNTIRALKEDNTIIIKNCDKNLGICLIDRTFYEAEALRQLNDKSTYTQLTMRPLVTLIYAKLRKLLHDHCLLYKNEEKNILSDLAKYLLQDSTKPLQLSRFYLLMKVHKTPVVGRPICSCIGCPTYFASKYLDTVLQPIARKALSYIADSRSYAALLEEITFPSSCVFVTADIVSLYPSIETAKGIAALEFALNKHLKDQSHITFILKLSEWVLTNNYIQYGTNTVWHQIKGTAMGTPFAVSYATIYLAVFENEVFQKCKLLRSDFLLPLLYKRFVDDISSIYISPVDGQLFIDTFNSHDPSIIITADISAQFSVFLDVEQYKGKRFTQSGHLDLKLFQKAQNKYLYIPPHSYHQPFVFKSLISSEIKRYRLLCTDDNDFHNVKSAFYERLLLRGFTAASLDHFFVEAPTRESLLHNIKFPAVVKDNTEAPVIFKTVLTPRIQRLNISSILKPPESLFIEEPSSLLILRKKPIVCYKRGPTLGDALISSKHPFAIALIHPLEAVDG
jgi:hypothetical protein